jgi:hypothetical protein
MMLGDQHSAARLEEDRLWHERSGECTGGIQRGPRLAWQTPENKPNFPGITVGPEPANGDEMDTADDDGIW